MMRGEDNTQVLRFTLSDQDYCVPIEHVAEIVDGDRVRSLPGSDPHVEGITDLRGETTTIINPTSLLNVDTEVLAADGGQTQHRIIVLDSDTLGVDSEIGWCVSDVHEVTEVTDEKLDTESIGESPLLHGLIKDDGEFTIWLNPKQFVA